MLRDDGFHLKVHNRIKTNLVAAEIALEHVLKEIIDVLERSQNPFTSERASDIHDIMLRLRMKLIEEDSALSPGREHP